MQDHIEIAFTDIQPEQQELLVALLSEAGFEGFEEGDRQLKAFIPQKEYNRQILHELAFKYQLQFTESIIAAQNWNSTWEANFPPVIVDDFVVIRADFHPPVPSVEQEIVITPKMSFGTGHHATTYMMVQQMRRLSFTGRQVFDFGTGTGILAILAERLGAAAVDAIDNDDWSIANAAENFERNHCQNITLRNADAPEPGKQYDIILANINKNVILAHLPVLAPQLVPGGTLLLSGLLPEDENEIKEAAASYSLRFIEKQERNNWICLRFNR
ncbi:MAG: 50S ribosomal protein L11 methyltransferase [Chitinophagaceae bacterium]